MRRAPAASRIGRSRCDGIEPNPKVLARDRSQTVFTQDWLTFAGRIVNTHRLNHGRKRLTEYTDQFARAEQSYGVPGA